MKPLQSIAGSRSMLVPLAIFLVLAASCGEPAAAPSAEPGPADEVQSSRLAGRDRIGTSIEIARAAFPDGAETVYLAGADRMADAVAGGSLTRGPTLLVPSCGPIPGELVAEIQRLSPTEVVALGGPVAVCDDTLREARIAAEPDVRYRVEVDAAIGGTGGEGLSVTVEQPPPLSLRQMSRHLVTFESTTERSLEELPYYAAETSDENSAGGWLGVAAVCGNAWTPSGARVQGEICPGASPAVGVAPGEQLTVPLFLYGRTDSGRVREGTYTVVAPLDARGAELILTYEVSAAD